MENRKNIPINMRKITLDKFKIIQDFIKPTPTALDLLDHILDKFIEIEKIPVKIIKKQEAEIVNSN